MTEPVPAAGTSRPEEVDEPMCKATHEPGGPRRCSADARRGLQHAAAKVAGLEERHQQMAGLLTAARPVMTLPAAVGDAIEVAAAAGTPFIVGGAVRDALLGGDPKDFDLEVHDTDLDELTRRFAGAGWEVDEVGRQFGVLKVSRAGQEALDVAVPRRENKVAAGHRGFSVETAAMSVTEAAARRDFTINAIYYDPQAGALVDPFGGVADLNARVLRHVSDAFGEDPLRVLRGVQFASRFAMTFDPQTARVCRRLRPRFAELATERVQIEWGKLYAGSHPQMGAAALQAVGWDDTVPGLTSALAQPRTVAALNRLPATDRAAIGAAVIATAMKPADRRRFLAATVVGKDTATIAADLAATSPEALSTTAARKTYAHEMARRGFTFGRYQRYARSIGDPAAIAAAQAALDEGLEAGPEAGWIQGRDVVAAAKGRKPGPWVGDLVDAALAGQYRGEFNNRIAALSWLNSRVQGAGGKPPN